MEAIASSMGIAAYLLLFFAVGLLFIFVNLLIGRFVRPDNPSEEKAEIYECGEPSIGTSYIQFDLRFYVVALLFIIFDVEVAFFFPWAVVFGKSANMADPNFDVVAAETDTLSEDAALLYREMGVRDASLPT
ncbi:MAG: NADH-quinone oxidoreductase subunit A, partial [bacterium]|nr:NADH-quinone oxidoreductase subunit A [bacterium]